MIKSIPHSSGEGGSSCTESGSTASPKSDSSRKSELADLIERVAAATEGSRELDAEIAVALSGDAEAWVVNPAPRSIFSAVPGWWRDSADKSHCAPELTASLDAALALVERVLPDMVVRLDLDDRPRALLFERNGYVIGCRPTEWRAYADAPTPALALILAMLKALEGQS